MAQTDVAQLVERIWSRDPTVWTGDEESQWLGWLDEPLRMRERVHELLELASTLEFERVCLLGMGGSSLAPEVLKRLFGVGRFETLDTTHPSAVQRVETDGTLFVSASKSGSTLETRSHTDYFWERTGEDGAHFVAITDPGRSSKRLRASAASARSSTASRRSAGATRRCRRSGSFPRS